MKYLFLLILSVPFLSCTSTNKENKTSLPYENTWESVSQFPKSPEFFLDAKFGIYTHWGPVTVASDHPIPVGGVQWHGQHMYDKNYPAYFYHRERFGDQHEVGYKEITRMFRGEKFDAKEWAEIFARSGAKFAGPVAIHHDNYAMWASKVTRWNSVDGTPGKDFTGELAEAIKAKGMMYFTSFHHSYTWDYFNLAYEFDAADGLNKDLYCEVHEELDPPSREFLENWLAMVNEVVVKYEPDMIWFDFGLGRLIPDEYPLKMFADYYNWAAANERKAVVFHKHEKIQRYTGVLDFERGRASKQTTYPWLTDTSLGPWFHDPSYPYYTSNQLVDILVDIISKNGCMLLNVGPRADGSIPDEAKNILAEIGDWLAINGEAVFETRPWRVFGEGPTRLDKSGGFNEKASFKYTSEDIRFTRSKDGKNVFAFILGWPEGEEVLINSFKRENGLSADNISAISLLGSDAKISFHDTGEGLAIGVPEIAPSDHAICFKLELK